MLSGGLLGAVFGLMGSIASLMGFVEEVSKKLKDKMMRKNNIEKINKSRKRIESSFEKEQFVHQKQLDCVSYFCNQTLY